jgi:hypothetical protein
VVATGARERAALEKTGFRIAETVNRHEGQGTPSVTVELLNGFLEPIYPAPTVPVSPALREGMASIVCRCITAQIALRSRLSDKRPCDPDLDDEDHQLRVADRVDDPIPAYSDAVSIVLAHEFFATGRPGIIGQRTDAGNDAFTVLLLVNGLDLFGRGRTDQDPIFFHAA